MIDVSFPKDFDSFRNIARELILSQVPPAGIIWTDGSQASLFQGSDPPTGKKETFGVTAAFIELARAAACYDDQRRWSAIYTVLFRLVYENRHLLEIESDRDVRQMRLMAKAVGRDVHKFHAFVRFRRIECNGEEIFVAWHEPRHFTVELAAPFFARRFGSMNFSILTPKGCAHWNKHLNRLSYSAPADSRNAPDGDEMEELWLGYYRSIFNPFRLKVSAMKRELPVRHWPTLPETALIPELIELARSE